MEFRVSSELKSIIGKDLIVKDEVAIFELVKNSYDAHATRVDIIFEKDKIIIKDNGKGMDITDIKNKWLFLGYSAKKSGEEDLELQEKKFSEYRNKINLHRGYAGAKGIGRFSSDRLGTKLKLLTRKVDTTDIHQLDIDWNNFEKDSKEEFINIGIDYSVNKSKEYDDLKHGVILEISSLRSQWSDKRINSLKRSLSKLVNPFEINTINNSFEIFVKRVNSLEEEVVENELLDILSLKTTKLELEVKKEIITTKLTDRGTLVYSIEEKNPYEHIKNTSIILVYLNRKARHNFTSRMGITTSEFANVMLYNNGFRIYPYGEPSDDSFGIDKRHQQGYSRYLSTRNVMGSVNVNEYSDQFKEKTSRDGGLIYTHGYDELLELFWEKSLKRLEKYIVGVQWKLSPTMRNIDNESEDSITLENLDSRKRSIEMITHLIDNEGVTIKEYDSNFLNLLDDDIDLLDPIVEQLLSLAQKTNDKDLLDNIEKTKVEFIKLQQAQIQAEVEREQAEKAREKAEKSQKEAEAKYQKEKEEKEKVEAQLEQKTKQVIFQSALVGTDKEKIIGMQHQISHSSSRIKRSIQLFLKSVDANSLTQEEKKRLGIITLEASKIKSLSNYITKANFNHTANEIEADFFEFVKQYIKELYLAENKIIDLDFIENIDLYDSPNIEINMDIRPLELTMVIDSLIHNADKANASQMKFSYEISDKNFTLFVEDNGKGIKEENLDKIFELGFTTTRGSGIGLFNVKQTLAEMGGSISVSSEINKGTKFSIRFKR